MRSNGELHQRKFTAFSRGTEQNLTDAKDNTERKPEKGGGVVLWTTTKDQKKTTFTVIVKEGRRFPLGEVKASRGQRVGT